MAAFALPSLVCLRSVYNDKYLRYRYENVQTRGLLQFAGENVMDPYNQFEVEKAKTWAGLVHLKSRYTNKYLLGNYACLSKSAAPFDSCLFAGSKDPDKDSCDVLATIDRESILRFPRRVAFKGDNGLFLGATMHDGQPGLRFAFSDPKDPQVVQQIFPAPNGTIFIRSEHYGKFWRTDEDDWNWIVVDAEDPAVLRILMSCLGTLCLTPTQLLSLA
ncbi:hypothetical protein Cgig2_030062 [Carnegiea gigantea]|uniref:Agglutinin domain-containing protein n=1 Tax=Carnegiea gigantea TaxID=171969 RepID=A0A9Q1GIG7_9CARY|nr:hypothetical protein Cgig2_030062 [Carnegiea gigantea]